jgi:hypothetical protein
MILTTLKRGTELSELRTWFSARFKITVAINIKVTASWVMKPCSLKEVPALERNMLPPV